MVLLVSDHETPSVHAAAPELAAARLAAASARLATAAAAQVAATAAAAATIGAIAATAAGATAAAVGHRLDGWHLLLLGPRRLPALWLLCRLGLHVVAHAAMTPGGDVIGNLEMRHIRRQVGSGGEPASVLTSSAPASSI